MTLIQHWDGHVWNTVSAPSPHGEYVTLRGITAVSANDIWAVGQADGGPDILSFILHWDGEYWSQVASPNPGNNSNELYGISAISRNDIWAIGAYDNYQALILHWDGTRWSQVTSLDTAITGTDFRAITAIAPDDVWAVGAFGDDNSPVSYTHMVAIHWDGNRWNIVQTPSIGTSSLLRGIAAISGNDVWAVGEYNDSEIAHTLILHWDGKVWSTVSSPNSPSGENTLSGVAAITKDDIWAVGGNEHGKDSATFTIHWDGTQWNVIPSPQPKYNQGLRAVAVVSQNEALAVGAAGPDSDDLPVITHALMARFVRTPCAAAITTK